MKAAPRFWALVAAALSIGAGCGEEGVLFATSSTTGAGSTGAGAGGAGGDGGAATTTTTSTGEETTTSTVVGAGGAGGAETTTSSSSSTSSTTGSGGSQPVGCMNDVSAGHHQFNCDGGIKYDVEIPPACVGGGCGLILDMHGFTMNADSEDKGTGMRARGKQLGYVIVQPTAPGLPSSWDQATHAPLVFDFVQDAANALDVDPKRIHVMGFSQGGGMTWRLVCMHADYFASASPIGAIDGCEYSGANAPPAEIPILQVHGHKDNIVNFQGAAIPQRDKALAYWKYDVAGAVVIEEDAAHKGTRYLSPSGTVFAFWEHDYQAGSFILGGHCFPGGPDKGLSPLQFGCNDANTFVYGEMAMTFFLAHPKP